MKAEMVVDILYSNHIHCTVDKRLLEKLLIGMDHQGIKISMINADALQENNLDKTTVLINTLGSYYPEQGWGVLQAFFQQGGRIINLGPKPFTIPYWIQKNCMKVFEETERAIQSLGIVDAFVPHG